MTTTTTKEKTYLVRWEVEIEATSFEAAAEQAETLFLSADDQTAWVYQATSPSGKTRNVQVKEGRGRVLKS